MNPDLSAFHPQQIDRLRTDAHQAVRRYVEKHEAALRLLDQDEFYDILVIYLDALFECAEYAHFLTRVDEGIALTVDRPEFGSREEGLYHHLLFRKAAACYHLGKEEHCTHILREILRLNPDHPLAARFLIRCQNRQRKETRQTIRALTIGLFLGTVLVLILEALWIKPFLEEYLSLVVGMRNGLFLAGWLTLLGGEGLLQWQSTREVQRFRAGLSRKNRLSHQREKKPWH